MASLSSSSSSSSSSVFIFFFIFTTTITEARELLVGGSNNAWKVPSPTSQTLNEWAESTRFHVGDSLVWNLKDNKDSVLQVSRADYLSCNTSSPIGAHEEGGSSVVVKLDRSGPYYFISGAGNGACDKGQKMAVVVMAERKQQGHAGQFFVTGGSPSPAPAPVGFENGPALAPTSGARRVVVGAVVVVGLGVVMGLGL